MMQQKNDVPNLYASEKMIHAMMGQQSWNRLKKVKKCPKCPEKQTNLDTLLLFNLESKYLEQKEQILRTSISTAQIPQNLPGNPYP